MLVNRMPVPNDHTVAVDVVNGFAQLNITAVFKGLAHLVIDAPVQYSKASNLPGQ